MRGECPDVDEQKMASSAFSEQRLQFLDALKREIGMIAKGLIEEAEALRKQQ